MATSHSTARRRLRAGLAAAVLTLGVGAVVTATTPVLAAPVPGMAAAPYEYFGWGNPQDPATVMTRTGIRWFTLAFILSDGGCNPKWDGKRALTGGVDQANINKIRARGGDIVVSFGGWAGAKLGEKCSSAAALAGAYQKVITAYKLKAIDIDIENTEFHSNAAQQRVVDALKIVKSKNAGIKTYITIGTLQSGPDSWGVSMINRGAAAGLDADYVVMPFEFGGGTTNMATLSKKAADGLKNRVKAAYRYSDDVAYRHIGISSMNGKAGAGERVSVADFRTMLTYANQHHLARFTYWAINRDRPCSGANNDGDSCSGITQQPYDFTKVIAGYAG
jgi:chitinase